MRLAYVTSAYPAVSHTFIAREVAGLRAAGVDVRTFTVRRTPPEQLLTDADRREASQTYAIQPPRPLHVARAHVAALTRSPRSYLATLGLALRMSSGGARAGLWQLFYFAEAIVLWHRGSADRIDHVHAHFANVASMLALLSAAYAGWTWSFTMHGPTEFDDVTRYALPEKVRRASFVACIGEFCRSQLMKHVEPEQWDKLAIVRVGLDPDAFPPPPERRTDGPFEVLCVGRLVPDKGQALLLDALAALRAQGVEARVTLVGDGPDRGALEHRAAALQVGDAVRFTGSVGQDRIRELYWAADAFCLPSFAEGVPVVLMEAMATELPVVSTWVAGIPELVEHGVSGLLVPPGDPAALTTALAELGSDAARRRAMGERGRVRVRASYNLPESVERLRALFAGQMPA